MNVLTPRRRAILAAIWRSNGLLYTTIKQSVGLASNASMHYQLHALRRGGYVKFIPGQVRTLTLTGKGLLAAQGYELIYTCDENGIKLDDNVH